MAKTTRNSKSEAPAGPKPATRTRTTKPRVASAGIATATLPTSEQIRKRAFEIYLRRNGGPGDPVADWVQAERELTRELNGN